MVYWLPILILWANRKDGTTFTFVSCSTCLDTLIIQEVFVKWLNKTLWIYKHLYVYVHIYVYTYICTHIHEYVHIFMFHTAIVINTYLQSGVCVCSCVLKYRDWVRNSLNPWLWYTLYYWRITDFRNKTHLALNPDSTTNHFLTFSNLSDVSKSLLSSVSTQ